MELRDDEYEKDGAIYCKKCNTPRGGMIEGRMIRCACKCQKEKLAAEEAEFARRMRQAEILSIKGSVLGKRYCGVSFSTTDRVKSKTFAAALERCRKYCEVADAVLNKGWGIYLWGEAGTGKTHLAACIANELIERGYQVIMTNLSEITKNGKLSAEYIGQLSDIDFLIFDDIGVDRVKTSTGDTWLQERLYEIINSRYNNQKPTIFTSNYAIAELITERGVQKRTVDRIAEMSSAVIKIEGESFRLKTRAAAKLPF